MLGADSGRLLRVEPWLQRYELPKGLQGRDRLAQLRLRQGAFMGSVAMRMASSTYLYRLRRLHDCARLFWQLNLAERLEYWSVVPGKWRCFRRLRSWCISVTVMEV